MPDSSPPLSARPAVRLPWPLPAALAWTLAWGVWAIGRSLGWPTWVGLAAAAAAGGVVSLTCQGLRRRTITALGFPFSVLALGLVPAWSAWIWLLLLLGVLAVYPLRAWSDAPFFPTPAGALRGVSRVTGQPRRVLDAGCGLGHGLQALHAAWPQAEVHGVEWSALLAWAAARRCRFATVRRGDMWAVSWVGHDLVYLFQRPESMARALAKARRELAPGAWLASLDFAVPEEPPTACVQIEGLRPVWLYRMPGTTADADPTWRSTEGAAGR